ncbi:hypothetical protein SAMN04487968_105263 [Nocardioides terrae]|uniref:Uncharacterized protein n=1 Tax=Nocardioides terrae TaxID=574651 RepID=A0A1I1IN92_9ACTN|nr:hypothetical protein [Nocardioides terrae]SFC34700.1 hypothetical protein SAMN04487968_105263 [Nocardioides terrae]
MTTISGKLVSHDTYAALFGLAYLGLVTNLLLVVGCLPVVLLLAMTDPVTTWPLVALLAPSCAPALAGAFGVFREHAGGNGDVVRAFVAGWRAGWGRPVRLAAVATLLVVVLLADVRALGGSGLGVAVVPALAVLTVVVVATSLVGLVAVSEEPRVRLVTVIRVGSYLALRRWYLSLFSILALATQFAVFASMPAIALGLTGAPVLYVVWANSRFILRPALAATPATPATA